MTAESCFLIALLDAVVFVVAVSSIRMRLFMGTVTFEFLILPECAVI